VGQPEPATSPAEPRPLAGRKVVLGVCGGIAAYKAVEICRRLVDLGAEVAPVMTPAAGRFLGAATLSALASQPVRSSLWEGPEPIPHTRLGQWADLVLVAPATARLIGSYAAGISSDLLCATLLATRAKVVICPAMHTEMWEHPAVVDNLALLRRRGVTVVEPSSGRLAGGDTGPGRLADPERIVEAVVELLARASGAEGASLAGLRAVVSAGGTKEPLDPVRYLGNRSSGKQGYAVAVELARRGAQVTLVSAATESLPDPPGVAVVPAPTAQDMEREVLLAAREAELVVMAAAVADFRPKAPAEAKLKKEHGPPEVVLEPTPDILAELGRRRRHGQVLVGFAAETAGGSDLEAAARAKLVSKGVDLVVANDVSAPGVGFAHDTNAVVIVSAEDGALEVPLADKAVVAAAIVDAATRLWQHRKAAQGGAGARQENHP